MQKLLALIGVVKLSSIDTVTEKEGFCSSAGSSLMVAPPWVRMLLVLYAVAANPSSWPPLRHPPSSRCPPATIAATLN